MLYRYFRNPAISITQTETLIANTKKALGISSLAIMTEICFYVEAIARLTNPEINILRWLLRETFDPDGFENHTFLEKDTTVIEIGPRLNFETAWSSSAVAICHACGLVKITRLERSTRYGLSIALKQATADKFANSLHDRMTEMYSGTQILNTP